MRIKVFIFIIIAGIPLINLAQNIPNGNFEIWTENNSGMPQPQYWETQNEQKIIYVEALPGHSGNYAACLNVQWDNMLKKYCNASLNTEFLLDEKKKYNNLYGFLRGNAENIDTLFIEVYMFKGKELIGKGFYKILNNSANWVHFEIPIKYSNHKKPDRAGIKISVNPDNGSHFLTTYCIDDLLLANSNTVENQLADQSKKT